MIAWPPYKTGRFCKCCVGSALVIWVELKKGRRLAPLFDLALVVGAAEVVSTHHALDTALGVDDTLLAGPERVALAADFSPQVIFC